MFFSLVILRSPEVQCYVMTLTKLMFIYLFFILFIFIFLFFLIKLKQEVLIVSRVQVVALYANEQLIIAMETWNL